LLASAPAALPLFFLDGDDSSLDGKGTEIVQTDRMYGGAAPIGSLAYKNVSAGLLAKSRLS
jgi:hypothetical protein